jgi:PAS domain S-box-containing protein
MENSMESCKNTRDIHIDSFKYALNSPFIPWMEASKHYAGLLSALKRIEQERRRYQTLFDKAPEGYLITDVAATIQEANRQAALLLTVSQSDLIGKPFERFVAAEEREVFRAYLERFQREPRVVSMEVTLETQPGAGFPAALTMYAIHGPEEEWIGVGVLFRSIAEDKPLRRALQGGSWLYRTSREARCRGLGVVRDTLEDRVTACMAALQQHNEQLQAEVLERRRAEDALRESNERFYNLIVGSIQGMLVHREDRALFVNQAFADIFGYDRPEDILGMESLWVLMAPHERERLAGYHDARLQGKDAPLRYEYQGMRRDGSPVWVENNVTLVNWKGTTAIQSTAVDVTERKRVERDLQESQEKLWKLAANLQERQEEERKHITREIHDELGQVLTSLKIDAVWLARQKTQVPTAWQDRIAMMTSQIDSLIDTVRRIGTQLRPHILDDLGLVAAMEYLLQDVRRRTGMIYRLSVPSEELAIEPTRTTALFRIFQEALTNVIRHAQASMVIVRLLQQSDTLCLEVCDNGQGISRQQLASRDALGLRSMRERAALWDGTVEMQGKPGKGTTVTVRMPAGLSSREEKEDDSYSCC